MNNESLMPKTKYENLKMCEAFNLTTTNETSKSEAALSLRKCYDEFMMQEQFVRNKVKFIEVLCNIIPPLRQWMLDNFFTNKVRQMRQP